MIAFQRSIPLVIDAFYVRIKRYMIPLEQGLLPTRSRRSYSRKNRRVTSL